LLGHDDLNDSRTRLTQRLVLEGPGAEAYVPTMEEHFGANISRVWGSSPSRSRDILPVGKPLGEWSERLIMVFELTRFAGDVAALGRSMAFPYQTDQGQR
jgi:hypothetical protein